MRALPVWFPVRGLQPGQDCAKGVVGPGSPRAEIFCVPGEPGWNGASRQVRVQAPISLGVRF